jgi:N-acetylglucosamine-6-sulfatase
MQMRHRSLLAAVAAASVVAGGLTASTTARSHPNVRKRPATATTPDRPNIVFVLTDDLSSNLVSYMPHVLGLERTGLTFRNYFVSDSLCCPSRSSILTGNFPHDTGVFSNVGSQGGFHVFHARGEESHTFAVGLSRTGYRTALMGKYLNGYMGGPGSAADVPPTYVPPGWDEWDVAGNGYPEFDYTLNENGRLHAYGHQPSDYLTDVLARKGVEFINRSADADKPFFLELATFAPHSPYVPAPRDEVHFPGLKAPRPPNFDVLPTDAPGWLALRPRLTPKQIDQIDQVFRRRAQAVQAIDDLIAKIQAAVATNGLQRRTYIVFSSDNGLHTGQYRLMPGKLTPYDFDVRVPLIVTGPGVPQGAVSDKMTENIDLAPTFEGLTGTHTPSDGHSLVQLFHGQQVPNWRNAILVEHHGADLRGIDPDFQQPPSGNPTTYEAMRAGRFLYVEYRDGEREFYDLGRDPFELHNIAAKLSPMALLRLHLELDALERCHDGSACWQAMHVAGQPKA